tara:strand:+ start:444 stop:935 length:492 start_codon:yes stop_codon:yes gene_type:complete
MNYLRISLGIFIALAASRFIPHPPNFTSLLALSFYVPALLGIRFIPALILCFALTDLIIGFHSTALFTWGSVLLIGLMSSYFAKSIMTRISGALLGALVFFIITNFGVWTNGMYGYNIEGLVACYTMAIPFFTYSLISTLLFSSIIEAIYKIRIFSIINNFVK